METEFDVDAQIKYTQMHLFFCGNSGEDDGGF